MESLSLLSTLLLSCHVVRMSSPYFGVVANTYCKLGQGFNAALLPTAECGRGGTASRAVQRRLRGVRVPARRVLGAVRVLLPRGQHGLLRQQLHHGQGEPAGQSGGTSSTLLGFRVKYCGLCYFHMVLFDFFTII